MPIHFSFIQAFFKDPIELLGLFLEKNTIQYICLNRGVKFHTTKISFISQMTALTTLIGCFVYSRTSSIISATESTRSINISTASTITEGVGLEITMD